MANALSSSAEFKSKTALITGGTKGLGLEVARQLSARGARVLLTYRSDAAGAEAVCKELAGAGARCEVLACDLTEEGATERLFDWVRSHTQTLDFYVHNAAATAFKPLADLKSHHIDKTFNLTIKSFILALPHLQSLMSKGGAIVTVSGMDTKRAVPFHGLLGAAKAALETLTNYVAHELGPHGIRCNGVNPGFLDTDSTRKYAGEAFDDVSKYFADLTPTKEVAKNAEVASVIRFLLSEESRWIVGQTINVDGGQDFAMPAGM